MKNFVLIVLSLCLAYNLNFAQSDSYFRVEKIGSEKAYSMMGVGTVTIVLPRGSNQVLSATQTLPFPWKFFGQDVSTYKVSDNGYITFDATATTSDQNNVALPNVNAPKNAIFAFWDDLELKQHPNSASYWTDVRTFTYGTTPNRVHVIAWYLVSQAGIAANTSFAYFALRINESGDFDIVYNYCTSAFQTTTKATIGLQNADGTSAVMVNGSPDLGFPNYLGNVNSSNATDKIYIFKYGLQKNYDVQVVTADIDNPLIKNTPISVKATLQNWGKNAITNATFNYSVDGGQTNSNDIQSINIPANGGTLQVSHSVTYNPTEAGKFVDFKVWISKVNGQDDENPTNDTANTSVFVINGTTAPKKVLLEEGSGGWCGFCPDGHLVMRNLLKAQPNIVGVVLHNADSMNTPEGDVINSTFATGYPYGMVDRVKFADKSDVGLSRSDWSSKAVSQLNAKSPFSLEIDKTYNPDTRKIDITVNAKSVDYANGDIRLNVYVVEDKVRGSDKNSFYTQHSYYSHERSQPAGGTSHELYNEPEYFKGYFHNHCVRAILTGNWGEEGVIPAIVTPDQTYTKTFSYTIPPVINVGYSTPGINTKFQSTDPGAGRNKPEDTYIVVFLSYFNTDIEKCSSINVLEIPVIGTTSVNEETKTDNMVCSINPSPASGLTSVAFTVTERTNAEINIYNSVGKLVQKLSSAEFMVGTHYLFFDASLFANGTYFVNIKTANGTLTKSFSINK
ncbi:MAG: Omp28-related outer membrane protein [Bacteroidota bacterium]